MDRHRRMNDDRDQHNERFKQALDEMFGPAYADYARRVPSKLIPWVF